jgi:uncharacterized membrane protein YkgB
MGVRPAALSGLLGQQAGHPGCRRLDRSFVMTVTIIPFMPNGRDPAAGFPAMAGNVPFLMKDVVLLAASIYLLKQDVVRVALGSPKMTTERAAEF